MNLCITIPQYTRLLPLHQASNLSVAQSKGTEQPARDTLRRCYADLCLLLMLCMFASVHGGSEVRSSNLDLSIVGARREEVTGGCRDSHGERVRASC
jgi:hypothetical protein